MPEPYRWWILVTATCITPWLAYVRYRFAVEPLWLYPLLGNPTPNTHLSKWWRVYYIRPDNVKMTMGATMFAILIGWWFAFGSSRYRTPGLWLLMISGLGVANFVCAFIAIHSLW